MQAIILAGGKGTRLRPFTTFLPKPLVPIGGSPILEIVLRQLRGYGFTRVTLAVNHLAELVTAFFGTGAKVGLDISYSREEKELGTAGPLSLINDLDEIVLVMNGDLLTTLDYSKLLAYHHQQKADVTICTYAKEIKIDLGVLDITNDEFVDYHEKPTVTYQVSTGIYVLNREIIQAIPKNERLDMPDLMLALKKQGKRISCYQEPFYWLDIGRVEDYETANSIFDERRHDFLPKE